MARYIPESDLPATATDAEVQAILDALKARRYKLHNKAERYVVGPWKMKAPAFVDAIIAHLEDGCRIFHKPISNPPSNTLFFSANVCRDPEFNDEEDDIYVEIRFENNAVVILCDAHNHYDWQPRLPK
ncbi:MAG: hypothetical protein P4L99_25670 [Chthoniobacter sp.]|nr:hypothetical protein [Chthoniobacter sp.]